MEQLVSMSLEDLERLLSIAMTMLASQAHQECGDVMHLTPVAECKVSTSTVYLQVKPNMLQHNINLINLTGQLVAESVFVSFTLHTEPRANPPEFTISCHTQGGPATTVKWTVDGVPVDEDSDEYETSQIVLDTYSSEYENKLRVRGRRNGKYNCSISDNKIIFLPYQHAYPVNDSIVIKGI